MTKKKVKISKSGAVELSEAVLSDEDLSRVQGGNGKSEETTMFKLQKANDELKRSNQIRPLVGTVRK